jgi:hypothetical protein
MGIALAYARALACWMILTLDLGLWTLDLGLWTLDTRTKIGTLNTKIGTLCTKIGTLYTEIGTMKWAKLLQTKEKGEITSKMEENLQKTQAKMGMRDRENHPVS